LAFGDRLRSKIANLPGVNSVALSYSSPVYGLGVSSFKSEGKSQPGGATESYGYVDFVTPGFFRSYGIPLREGRDFTERDRPNSPNVAIISQYTADHLWPGGNPIGKRIEFLHENFGDIGWSEVVGVVANFSASGVLQPSMTGSVVFRPWAQTSDRFITISVSTSGSPQGLKETIRKAVSDLEPDIALTNLQTASESIDGQLSSFALIRRLLVAISLFGLLLSAVGIYGVISNLANERTREVGIRMALGAQPGDVLALFLRNGLYLSLLGTAIGLVGAVGLTTFLAKMIAVVPGGDPWVVASVATVLVIVSLIACWLPARRATRVNPCVALRAE
jgi:predicted permease